MNKNIYLSATRTIVNDFVYDETANYNLEISLTLKSLKINPEEITVYVYSSELYFAGKGSVSNTGNSVISLTVQSKWQWTSGLYYIYVFCDGKSKWFGNLAFGDDDEHASCRLKSINRYPQERFFAENLGICDWWRKLRPARFKEKLVRELIDRMKKLTDRLNRKEMKRVPPMLVTGDNIGAKALASMILGGFVSGDNVSEIYSFSISGITTGMCSWKSHEPMIMERKVVSVEIPQLEYNNYVVNILNMLASIIRQNAYNCTFILHGTEENINMMKTKCKLMDDLFDDDSTFNLTSDRSIVLAVEEDDDEFMRLLEEFISSETDDSSDNDNDNTDNNTDVDNDNESLSCFDEDRLYGINTCPAEIRLNEMIGLNNLKKDLEEARTMSMFFLKRKEFALSTDEENRNHMLFLGNPGTGKTTVAKLVGQIYHSMGLLSKGHTIETNRSKLIGEYIGQTEKRMLETIEQARGGVLFVDEAYNLITEENDNRDFGKEVINALLTVLSEPDPDMIVIFAGYENKMNKLMKVNPGLKDRFPLCFHFEDYSESELMEIARTSLDKMNYILTPEADSRLMKLISNAVKNKDEFFGNGRWVHNLIKHGIVKSMSIRVMSASKSRVLDENLLSIIEECDIIEAEKNFLDIKSAKVSTLRPIGFRA